MSEQNLADLQRQIEHERAARKQAERSLEEKISELTFANQLLQRYLDSVPCIMVALDTRGCISMINRAGCMLLDQPESALLGQAWFERFLPQPDGGPPVTAPGASPGRRTWPRTVRGSGSWPRHGSKAR